MKKLTYLFFAATLVMLFYTHDACAQDSKPIIRFGLIADIQYCDCETAGKRYYRKSLSKLEECVVDLNKEQVQFAVNLGDLIDRDPDSFDNVLARLDELQSPVYNTTGNHDYGGTADNKALYRKLGMPAEYYSFTEDKWRFIILNTNEIASYSNPEGIERETELEDMLAKAKETGRNNAYEWNGGISHHQMKWLRMELDKAEKEKESVIIFSHHPLYPENGLMALNNREILDMIDGYSCVKLLLAGHHHPGAFAMYNDIPVVTVEGMIETEKENAYGIVEIYEDKIIIEGKGRLTSREFELK